MGDFYDIKCSPSSARHMEMFAARWIAMPRSNPGRGFAFIEVGIKRIFAVVFMTSLGRRTYIHSHLFNAVQYASY